jgi:general stress protein 26
MADRSDIEPKFWKALRSDRSVMMGLEGDRDGLRPMTIQTDSDKKDSGPLWVFTSTNSHLVQALDGTQRVQASFVSKGHDLFAMIRGTVTLQNDRKQIDRLWNGFIAAWYPGGKDDPSLALLRFDAEEADIWLADVSFLQGMKLLFGADPRKELKPKSAKVRL